MANTSHMLVKYSEGGVVWVTRHTLYEHTPVF